MNLIKLSGIPVAACTVLIITFIGYLDYITHELGFSIFYVMLIIMVTWFLKRRTGIILSVFAALVWTMAQVLAGKQYYYSFAPYWNFVVRMLLFFTIVFAISKIKTILELEKKYARKDFVTGIANWQAFSEVAAREIAKCRRYKRPLAIAYIDCDNFKALNDSLGHKAGNDFLRSMAKSAQSNIREIDMAARVGGDEFVVLLPETSYESAQTVVKRLHDKLIGSVQKNKWTITFSIGVAVFVRPPDSIDEMVTKADNLMYEAKRNGKNLIKYSVFQ